MASITNKQSCGEQMSAIASFNDLPVDVIVGIFSRLVYTKVPKNVFETMTNLSTVCKLWYHAARSDFARHYIWNNVDPSLVFVTLAKSKVYRRELCTGARSFAEIIDPVGDFEELYTKNCFFGMICGGSTRIRRSLPIELIVHKLLPLCGRDVRTLKARIPLYYHAPYMHDEPITAKDEDSGCMPILSHLVSLPTKTSFDVAEGVCFGPTARLPATKLRDFVNALPDMINLRKLRIMASQNWCNTKLDMDHLSPYGPSLYGAYSESKKAWGYSGDVVVLPRPKADILGLRKLYVRGSIVLKKFIPACRNLESIVIRDGVAESDAFGTSASFRKIEFRRCCRTAA